MTEFDALRAAHPKLGMSAYAIRPGGPVTLEIVTPLGETHPFTAPTLTEAIALAFPYEPPVAAAAPTIEDAFG